jgi:hypothetical protein
MYNELSPAQPAKPLKRKPLGLKSNIFDMTQNISIKEVIKMKKYIVLSLILAIIIGFLLPYLFYQLENNACPVYYGEISNRNDNISHPDCAGEFIGAIVSRILFIPGIIIGGVIISLRHIPYLGIGEYFRYHADQLLISIMEIGAIIGNILVYWGLISMIIINNQRDGRNNNIEPHRT